MKSRVDTIATRVLAGLVVVVMALSGWGFVAPQGVSAQQPVEPVFEIEPGVSAQDAGFTIEGIRLAQDFFVNRLNADISIPLRVEVRSAADGDSPTRIAVANEDEITVYAGSRGWLQTSPAERYAVIVHEYTHFYQYLLLQEHNFDSPAWFDEGVAEFLSVIAMSEWGVIERADFETYWATLLALAPVEESFAELEAWTVYQAAEGAVYPLSYFAVAALFPDTSDLSPIERVYTLIGAGQSFQSAFTLAFGITPAEHYARIETNLGAPPASSDIPSDILIYQPIVRTTPFTPGEMPRSLDSDVQVLIKGTAMPASVCTLSLVDVATQTSLVDRTTFADGTGDVYWFMTVPAGSAGGLVSLDMACGGEPVERIAVIAS